MVGPTDGRSARSGRRRRKQTVGALKMERESVRSRMAAPARMLSGVEAPSASSGRRIASRAWGVFSSPSHAFLITLPLVFVVSLVSHRAIGLAESDRRRCTVASAQAQVPTIVASSVICLAAGIAIGAGGIWYWKFDPKTNVSLGGQEGVAEGKGGPPGGGEGKGGPPGGMGGMFGGKGGPPGGGK